MFLLPFITVLCLFIAGSEAKSIKKSHVNLLEPTLGTDDDWQGKWFPYTPGEPHIPQNVQRMHATASTPPADDWTGKWFPYVPGEPHVVKVTPQEEQEKSNTTPKDNWPGKWFPYVPGEPHVVKVTAQESPEEQEKGSTTPKDGWPGKWFPYVPGEPHVVKVTAQEIPKEQEKGSTTPKDWFPQTPSEPHKEDKNPLEVEETESLEVNICDDGKSNLRLDYDLNDIRDSLNYLCISSNRSLYQPDLSREAILTEHFLPSAYLPPAKCMNESIVYTHWPATNGPYRPLPAEYGVYSYLPPQRYLRNLAEGAIVMLYHPCASPGQVKQLQHIVSGCLYRHLISPSQDLSAERPLALLAWSRSLEMSVVDRRLVADFIQKHAKQGPLALEELSRVVDKRSTYSEGLTTEARLVTTADDYELCGYMEEGM